MNSSTGATTKFKKTSTYEFIEQTFHFWFNDHQHIRSPFPEYIREELQDQSIAKFKSWMSKVPKKAKDDINEEIVVEKFEEFIFETAGELVMTEDEKLTILYPFMPRTGDKIEATDENKESIIVDRMVTAKGDHKFFKVTLETTENKERWETEFELPA